VQVVKKMQKMFHVLCVSSNLRPPAQVEILTRDQG